MRVDRREIQRAQAAALGGAWEPPAGLLGWWYGDSLTDGKWTDRSERGYHATFVNGADVTTDGITLDGTTKYATVPHDVEVSETSFSVCAWVYCADRSTATRTVMNRQWFGTGYVPVFLGISNGIFGTTGRAQAATFDGTSWRYTQDTAALVENEWVHLAGTYRAGRVAFYRGGLFVSQSVGTWTMPADNSREWLIGRRYETSATWNGVLTDLHFYSGELSADQIADIFANSPGRPA